MSTLFTHGVDRATLQNMIKKAITKRLRLWKEFNADNQPFPVTTSALASSLEPFTVKPLHRKFKDYDESDVDAALRALYIIDYDPKLDDLTKDHLNVVRLLSQYRKPDANDKEWDAINRYALSNRADIDDLSLVLARGITEMSMILAVMEEKRNMPAAAMADGVL